jgi:hypothetical protein
MLNPNPGLRHDPGHPDSPWGARDHQKGSDVKDREYVITEAEMFRALGPG